MTTRFVPSSREPKHIGEFPMEEVFANLTEVPDEQKIVIYSVDGRDYRVNVGNSRYHLFKANRACVCCGLIGNRLILDEIFDRPGCYHFNLYAEQKDHGSETTYMVTMTRDHVIPKSAGGLDEYSNYQTLCYNCNTFKAQTNLSLEAIRQCIFTAHRIYKSTATLNLTKKKLHLNKFSLESIQNSVDAIEKGMQKCTNPDSIKAMKAKQESRRELAIRLKSVIEKIELEAQRTGIIPYDADLEKAFEKPKVR